MHLLTNVPPISACIEADAMTSKLGFTLKLTFNGDLIMEKEVAGKSRDCTHVFSFLVLIKHLYKITDTTLELSVF